VKDLPRPVVIDVCGCFGARGDRTPPEGFGGEGRRLRPRKPRRFERVAAPPPEPPPSRAA
jgi:hypothetical protein